MISVGLTSRRLPPLAPQVSQVGNAALVEREAITLPLDHAFGFELADVGPAAIEVQRQRRRADGRGLSGLRAGDQWRRSQPSCSFLLRRGRIAHFRFRRHSGPRRDLPPASPVANDPKGDIR